jgi:ATP-dependent Lhr-like helicase
LTLAARTEVANPSPAARAVVDCIARRGALFFDEIVEGTGILRTQVEEALGELVGLGLVSSDSFAGLRALLVPSSDRSSGTAIRRRKAKAGMEAAGRWALARRTDNQTLDARAKAAAIEHVARALLKRYGVVFWRLLAREAPWLPPWRDLLRVYRRLESRGDIRGGRFVSGFSGEQFALPEAIGSLREIRRQPPSLAWASISGGDPLNLIGFVTPGPRVPALTGNRLLYRDGLPVASLVAGKVEVFETLDPEQEWQARKALLQSPLQKPSPQPEMRLRGKQGRVRNTPHGVARPSQTSPSPVLGRK